MSLEFVLGLPYLRGPLLAKAIEMKAPILVSANAFSVWESFGPEFLYKKRKHKKPKLVRERKWLKFRRPPLSRFGHVPIRLDSAGFVAMSEYGGFPWTVDDYLDLCAAAPWDWFASMDMCVEPEIAVNESDIFDRIAGTVRLNLLCMNGAEERGIQDRLMPVIQGWEPHHYLRCLDRMSACLDGRKLVGVGSMCRRHVEGWTGILEVVDALDRALPAGVKLHLFGLKSQGMAELRGHDRIASVDSQAYGIRARQIALESDDKDFKKTEEFVASVMAGWYGEQIAHLAKIDYKFRFPNPQLCLGMRAYRNDIDRRVAEAAEAVRELVECGEMEFEDLNPLSALEFAFMDEDDE